LGSLGVSSLVVLSPRSAGPDPSRWVRSAGGRPRHAASPGASLRSTRPDASAAPRPAPTRSTARSLHHMRLLQVTSSTQRRGAEVFAAQLAEGLTAEGLTVTTVALSGPDGPLGFDVIRTPRFDPRTVRELARRIRAHDVVLAHG